jgi:FAD/FMN-containing dehydrogenase
LGLAKLGTAPGKQLRKYIDWELNWGTISGEHGIGMLQKEFMPHQFSSAYLKLIKDIKRVFDPKNLLNPGKVI